MAPELSPFAPRNWLFQDEALPGELAPSPFGLFVEEGGTVVGPRFAERLRWTGDSRQFTMIYRNSIGQEIVRTGQLAGPNRIEGKAIGPGLVTWRWSAEAKPR